MTLFVGRAAPRSLYDSVSEASSAVVIREYSSSFGLASRLLAEPVRTQVRNVYALVRVADEIVDNPDPTLDRSARATMLDWLEGDVAHAMLAVDQSYTIAFPLLVQVHDITVSSASDSGFTDALFYADCGRATTPAGQAAQTDVNGLETIVGGN